MSGAQVRVRLGGEQYALAVKDVREIVDVGALTPVPGSGANLLGLRNLNGEVVPAFDLATILQIDGDGRPRRLLVAEHAGQCAAFAVDEVIDVGLLTGTMQESESRELLGSTIVDGTMVGVLAADALFDVITAGDKP